MPDLRGPEAIAAELEARLEVAEAVIKAQGAELAALRATLGARERRRAEDGASARRDRQRAAERFLPFTTKSRLSAFYWAVPLYLRVPLAWRFFGKQCFIVAEKR